MNRGYTLLELLLIVAIISLVALALIAKLNPLAQERKALDARRKYDLTVLSKMLEDFYNDKNRYPKPEEICWNSAPGTTNCKICGYKNTPSAITPYLPQLPCDSSKNPLGYYYEVSDTATPAWYRTYTKLENTLDQAIAEAGCSPSCPGNSSYNYGVSSPNKGL